MKPLPDLSNTEAMIARGRRGAIISARNEACQELRDVCVAIQGLDVYNDDPSEYCERGRLALTRLEELHRLAT